MFNSTLKKQALQIHDKSLNRYNESYKRMSESCEKLYKLRTKSVDFISFFENVINSIANTPKEYDKNISEIKEELRKFKDTEAYAQESFDASVKAGINIAGGAVAGIGVAAMAPTAMMSIATTFGTASTGTAISALSGAAAQKAAVAWLGRTFAGFAVKEGAGMAVGEAFLALAGPIGWGITAASTGISLISLTKKNEEIADQAINEAKEIEKAREALDESTEKINSIMSRTEILLNDLESNRSRIEKYFNKDYTSLSDDDCIFLGSMVNNTLSLSKLLNETVK